MKRSAFAVMTMLMMGLSTMGEASAAAVACTSCNSVSNTAACCRRLAGCETYASEQAGVNYCRASRPAPTPGHGVSRAQCQKNYASCIRGVTSRAGSVKATEVNGKKLSRKAVADALRAERATCQRRLAACRSGQ